MPPRTRGTKTTKILKENIEANQKLKSKPIGKSAKPRKALSDKTNSASDDNGSIEIPKVTTNVLKSKEKDNVQTKERPRRDRRAPSRFVESEVPKAVPQSKSPYKNENESPMKSVASILSPFKTPQNDAENSLLTNRPRRVCRLPSRFDDHSVSPNRFIPIGTIASTPIIQMKVKKSLDHNLSIENNNKLYEKPTSLNETKQVVLSNKKTPLKKPVSSVKASSDTNNNARQRSCRARKVVNKPTSPPKSGKDSSKISPVKSTYISKYSPFKNIKKSSKISPTKNIHKPVKKVTEQSFSFRVLEDKKRPSKRDSSHLDVYEFTYDPNEEPPPQKKKRKRAVTKKPAKPKTFVSKNNYDRNVSKALAALKNAVSKKPAQPPVLENVVESNHKDYEITKSVVANVIQKETIPQIITPSPHHASVQIEDIAADFEPLPDHHDIDYSPVTSPNRGTSPKPMNTPRRTSIARSTHDHDPLNLRDDLSFFDDIPVASSSMNVSVRHPGASPWRVEFGQLPIKWQSNTYVKPNMTPAVESSFINFDDSKNKKKHVYTNLLSECHDLLPEVEDNQPNLKQTSIISFMREVAEKSASKKKRAKSVTPTKANSMFHDLSNMSVGTHRDEYRTPKKTPRRAAPNENTTPNRYELLNTANNENKENCNEDVVSNQNEENAFESASKEKDKDGTFFGFDESEDQENVSPIKIDNPRVRALRPRAKAVLQEINAQTGPLRAKVPLAAKTKVAAMSEAVNKVYAEMKSATVAPVFPDKDAVENVATTNVEAQACNRDEISDDDSQSVHLFEDIELIHHLKPTRKSYGKAKKVTFRQASTSDSETQLNDGAPDDPISSGEDDLADLTFTMPNIEQKSKTKKRAKNKKKVLSKKEKAEVEAWAAGFNSMCEDIEEFPLLVE